MEKDSITSKLSELFELHKSGAISKEEYDLLKSQLLNDNVSNPPEAEQKTEQKEAMTTESEKSNISKTITESGTGGKMHKSKKKLGWKIIIPFLIIIIVSLSYIVLTHKSENQRFSELLISKDLVQAYEFKTKYPESKFNVDSLIKALEYKKVFASPSIQTCRKYLEKYNDDSVKVLLSELEWNEITGTPQTYSGPLVTKKGMDENAFRNNYDKINKFYNEFPFSKHCDEIEEWQFRYQNDGTFIDKRDNQRYTWQKVGDQIWMTQNLDYNTQKSCPSGDKEGGRAYHKSMIWDACVSGWDMPTLEDWYTLLFDLGAKLNVADDRHVMGLNCLLLSIDPGEMTTGSVFKPYLGFNYVEEDFYRTNCGNIRTDGASYWSKTYEMERMNPTYAISKEDLKWNKSLPLCMHFEPVLGNDGISRLLIINHYGGGGGYAHPIRCIKKNTKQPSDTLNSNAFVPFDNPGSVTIDGVIYNSDNLLTDGIYLPAGQNQEDYKNSILIKYIGKKMFFLIFERTGQYNDRLYAMKNYHILKSNDDRHFKLAVLTNYVQKNEVGEFMIENRTTIILTMNSAKPIEYQIIPNLGVYFGE